MPAKKGRKGRKIGRNAEKCKAYALTRYAVNKRFKLRRHLGEHPEDRCAMTALQLLK